MPKDARWVVRERFHTIVLGERTPCASVRRLHCRHMQQQYPRLRRTNERSEACHDSGREPPCRRVSLVPSLPLSHPHARRTMPIHARRGAYRWRGQNRLDSVHGCEIEEAACDLKREVLRHPTPPKGHRARGCQQRPLHHPRPPQPGHRAVPARPHQGPDRRGKVGALCQHNYLYEPGGCSADGSFLAL